jgi:trans-aconitate methyltransferase
LNARRYADNARFVTDLGMPVVELLAPHAGERILDLGCGDGPLTAKLAALGCSVVGIDGSPAMVAAARALGLDARVMDGHALSFDDEFDAVFSNAALHWMKRSDAVIAGFGGRWSAARRRVQVDNVGAIVAAPVPRKRRDWPHCPRSTPVPGNTRRCWSGRDFA